MIKPFNEKEKDMYLTLIKGVSMSLGDKYTVKSTAHMLKVENGISSRVKAPAETLEELNAAFDCTNIEVPKDATLELMSLNISIYREDFSICVIDIETPEQLAVLNATIKDFLLSWM